MTVTILTPIRPDTTTLTQKTQREEARLVVPDISGRELLPLSISPWVRALESQQSDTSDALREAFGEGNGSGEQYYATRHKIFSLLGFRAVELSWELRTAYRLSPPSPSHRKREKCIEEKLRYHDGFSIRIRRTERRIAREARMAAGNITQERNNGH